LHINPFLYKISPIGLKESYFSQTTLKVLADN